MKSDSTIEKNWQKILELVRAEITHESFFNDYVKKMKVISFSNSQLFVNTKSLFAKSVINDNYKLLFNKVSSDIFNEQINVVFLSEEEEKIFLWTNKLQSNNFNNEHNSNIQKEYTFENFVIGQHNSQACKAVKTVLVEKTIPWNPIFIYGNTGLGKTHLLFAVGNEYIKQNYDKRIEYVEANEYTQRVVNALSKGNSAVEILKKEFKKLDLLLIDDVQFLATREKTNEIFFDIFNTLYRLNKPIILTSDKPPEKLDGFAERMISRFASGLTVKISSPDIPTLEGIVEKKLSQMKIKNFFEKSAIRMLTNMYGDDIRRMNGALNSLSFYVKTQNNLTILNEKIVEKLLNDQEIIRTTNSRYDPEIIINRICRAYGVNVEDLKSKKRNAEIVNIRQICMYVLYKKIHLNLTQIGTLLRRDHSTVISSIKKIEKSIQTNVEIKEYIENEKWKK